MNCFPLVSADEEFDELCFEFGLELDEIVSKSNNTDETAVCPDVNLSGSKSLQLVLSKGSNKYKNWL